MKLKFLLLFMFFTFFSCRAQTLKGGVMGINNERISRAKISFKKSSEKAKTNSQGLFEIEFSTIKNDTLVVESRDYETVEVLAEKFNQGNGAFIYLTTKKQRKWKSFFPWLAKKKKKL